MNAVTRFLLVFLRVGPPPRQPGAITVRHGLLAAIKTLPEHVVKTLTLD